MRRPRGTERRQQCKIVRAEAVGVGLNLIIVFICYVDIYLHRINVPWLFIPHESNCASPNTDLKVSELMTRRLLLLLPVIHVDVCGKKQQKT